MLHATEEFVAFEVPSPSGKAKVCKTFIPGSNPGGTSKKHYDSADYKPFFVFEKYKNIGSCWGIAEDNHTLRIWLLDDWYRVCILLTFVIYCDNIALCYIIWRNKK